MAMGRFGPKISCVIPSFHKPRKSTIGRAIHAEEPFTSSSHRRVVASIPDTGSMVRDFFAHNILVTDWLDLPPTNNSLFNQQACATPPSYSLQHFVGSTNLVCGILPVSICQVSVFPVLYLFFRFPWQSDQDFCLFPHSFPAIILYFEENQDKIPVNFR